jgi:hypothetical protein
MMLMVLLRTASLRFEANSPCAQLFSPLILHSLSLSFSNTS